MKQLSFLQVRPCFHHISFEFDLKFIKILFLTLCKLRNFTYFLSSGDSPPIPPKYTLFRKILLKIHLCTIRASNSLDPDEDPVLSGLIWVQAVCKDYQQKTQADKELILNLRNSNIKLNNFFSMPTKFKQFYV